MGYLHRVRMLTNNMNCYSIKILVRSKIYTDISPAFYWDYLKERIWELRSTCNKLIEEMSRRF